MLHSFEELVIMYIMILMRACVEVKLHMLNIISAVPVMDIIFFVLIGVGLILGILGGVSRALKGFFAAVFIIFSSILLVGAFMKPMCAAAPARSISSSIEKTASGWGEAFTRPIYIEDGKYFIRLDSETVPIEDAEGKGLASKTKAALAKRLAERFINEDNEGTSLAGFAADSLTTVIVAVIAFVGFTLGIALIFLLLRKVFRTHVFKDGALGALNKILGGLVGAFMVMVFIFIVIAILRACHIPSVDKYFLSQPAFGYLYAHNPLASILSRIFG